MAWVPVTESGVTFLEFFADNEEVILDGSTAVAIALDYPRWGLNTYGNAVRVRITAVEYSAVDIGYPGEFSGPNSYQNQDSPDGWSPSQMEFEFSALTPTQLIYEPAGRNEGGTSNESFRFLIEVWVDEPPAPPEDDDTNCDCDCGYPTKTLAEMRNDLLIVMGYGAQLASPPASVVALANWHLNNAQRIAAQDVKEINAQRYFAWNVEAGQTKFCTTDNIETCRNVLAATRITEAWIVRTGNLRERLTRGITFDMAGNDNPRSIPTRYDVRSCIEIWPPPETALQLVVKGTLAAVDMVNDGDTPTVDPTLVLTRAIAFYKAGKGHQDAQIYMGQYNQYLSGLNKEAFNDYRFNVGHCRRDDRLTHVMERRVYDDGSTS